MSTTAKSQTTVTVELKKGTAFIFETPEVNRVEGTVLAIGESGRALRFPLDSVKTVRVVPRKEDVVDELLKLYAGALKQSPYSAYPYGTSLRW